MTTHRKINGTVIYLLAALALVIALACSSPVANRSSVATPEIAVPTTVVALATSTATPQPMQIPTATPRSSGGKPTGPFVVEIEFSEPPVLGKEVQLTSRVTSSGDLKEGEFEFVVPDGFEVVSGDTTWTGPFTRNDTHEFTITVKSTEIGERVVSAIAIFRPIPGSQGGNGKHLYVTISESSASVSTTAPRIPLEPGYNRSDGIDHTFPVTDARLVFSEPPDIGQQVELTLEVTPLIDVIDGMVVFDLGREFFTEDRKKVARLYVGSLPANEPQEFTIKVTATDKGNAEIIASLQDRQNEVKTAGDGIYAYVAIKERRATIFKEDELPPYWPLNGPRGSREPQTGIVFPPSSASY
jgi:hypothetical protein